MILRSISMHRRQHIKKTGFSHTFLHVTYRLEVKAQSEFDIEDTLLDYGRVDSFHNILSSLHFKQN